jgi:hypothetical protein
MAVRKAQKRIVRITLDEKTAALARVSAAERGTSVSRLLGKILQQHMREVRDYNEAMRRFQSIKPFDCEWMEGRGPTREELNDRSRFR